MIVLDVCFELALGTADSRHLTHANAGTPSNAQTTRIARMRKKAASDSIFRAGAQSHHVFVGTHDAKDTLASQMKLLAEKSAAGYFFPLLEGLLLAAAFAASKKFSDFSCAFREN